MFPISGICLCDSMIFESLIRWSILGALWRVMNLEGESSAGFNSSHMWTRNELVASLGPRFGSHEDSSDLSAS